MSEKTQDEKAAKTKAKRKEAKLRAEEAEARKQEIDLRRAELALELDELRAQDTRHNAHLKANSDSQHGIFTLQGTVRSAVADLAADIRQYCRTYPDAPVTLNIFSPGGSLLDGIVLHDSLRTISDQGHHVTTHVRGYAASMGAIISLAGDTRLIGAESLVMIHSLSAGTGGSLHDMEDDVRFYRLLQSRLDGIITSRTKVSKKLLAEKTKKVDWWLTPEEALELGVVHEIV